MQNEKELEEMSAVTILSNILAIVFDEGKSSEEIRNEVRKVLEQA